MKIFFVIVISILSPIFGENSPAFIWSNERETFPQVLAGHITSRKHFKDNYLLNHDNIIVFLRNNLDIGELISSGNVYSCGADAAFYNLKNIMVNHYSTYLPNVEDAVLSIEKLQKTYKHSVLDASSDYKLTDTEQFIGKNLLYVKFDDFMLSSIEIDKMIGKINQQLEDLHVKYLAIYTSKYVMEKHVAKRSADIDEKNATEFLITNKAFMMKVTEINIDGTNNTAVELNKVTFSENDCEPQNKSSVNYNCTIGMNLGDINSTMKNVIMVFHFATSRNPNKGFWYIEKFFLTYMNGSEEIKTELDSKFIDMTPLQYSYHCSFQPPPKPIIRSRNETANPNLLLTFKQLQLQVFMENTTSFGHYNDCVGFFTIPIWMFIISAVVLLTILYLGVSMLMSITTMDRYDDPKGKTISISATE